MRVFILSSLLLTIACGAEKQQNQSDTGVEAGANAEDTGDDTDSDDANQPLPAPIADLSDGECPDMSVSGTNTFSSSGESRTVTTVVPSNLEPGMPLVFFFHGLLDASTSSPSAYHVTALNLQSYADEMGVIFVLPESPIMNLAGFAFYMWTVDSFESPDIVLYDDLRTCANQQLEVDLNRVHAVGFSGGALFTTVVARDRGDTLASIIEMSGGSDVAIPLSTEPYSEYETSEYAMPALLITGGANDIWPDASFTIVDFAAATDSLQDQLVEDGHYVVRCDHGQGHTVTFDSMRVAWEWVTNHEYGVETPFGQAGITDFGDWCSVVD